MKILVDREWEGTFRGTPIDRHRLEDLPEGEDLGVVGDDRTLAAVLSALGERRVKTTTIAFKSAKGSTPVSRQLQASSGTTEIATLRLINSVRQTPLLGFQFGAGWLEKIAEAISRTRSSQKMALVEELKSLTSLHNEQLDLAVNGYVEKQARFVVASTLAEGWCGVGGDTPKVRVGRQWSDLVGHGWTRRLSSLLHHDPVLEQINVRAPNGYIVDGEFHIDSLPSVLHITPGPVVRLRNLEMK